MKKKKKVQCPVPVVRRINDKAVCYEDNYFPKEKLILFNSLFHSVYLVFSMLLFSMAYMFALLYVWKTYVTR